MSTGRTIFEQTLYLTSYVLFANSRTVLSRVGGQHRIGRAVVVIRATDSPQKAARCLCGIYLSEAVWRRDQVICILRGRWHRATGSEVVQPIGDLQEGS